MHYFCHNDGDAIAIAEKFIHYRVMVNHDHISNHIGNDIMTNALATLAKQTAKALDTAKKASATKPAAKASNQPKTAKPAARVFRYGIAVNRPATGRLLHAFTQAWLEMAGLDKGKAISRKEVEQVAGYTAVAYHLKNQRMQEKDGKISLTAAGKLFFKERAATVDTEQVNAMKSILRTGKPDGTIVKNAAAIVTLN